jgi:MbtH protein
MFSARSITSRFLTVWFTSYQLTCIFKQYSIWPSHRENALGWKDVGKSGSREECLPYIKEVWTDMRPLSLRKKMQEHGLA